MIFKKHEEVKTTHHIVVVNGYTIHRREKLEYDFKEKEWVRKSMTWNCDHVDLDRKYQFNNKPKLPSSKQLEREFQLMKILD